jgi:hypothetical protein
VSQLAILSVGHEASTRAERNAAQQLSPRKRLVHKVEPEVVTHALWAGMAIDVLDPSLELRVRLVSELAGQKRREWACRPVNGCRKLLFFNCSLINVDNNCNST